jgi:hypothetical protein
VYENGVKVRGIVYPALLWAQYSAENGLVSISSRELVDFAIISASPESIEIEGSLPVDGESAAVALNEFIGNFSGGGSSSSTTDVILVVTKSGMNGEIASAVFSWISDLKISEVRLMSNAAGIRFQIGNEIYDRASIIGREIPAGEELLIRDVEIEGGEDQANVIIVFKKARLESILPSTDIEFEVSVGSAFQSIADLIRMSSLSNNGRAVIDWGDGSRETVVVPKGILQQSAGADGFVFSWMEGVPFGHTYQSSGVYSVRVTSYATVDAVCFSTREAPPDGEWAEIPLDKPWITRMKKFKSESLQSLYYTFAGLVNMKMDEGFVLETPLVDNISFMMWRCGVGADDFALPAGLLSQITLPQVCYRTFMDSGISFIPAGFLDTLTNLRIAFEMFRACGRLGNYWYHNPLSNGGANDFIPVDLFWNLSQLRNITGIFNWIGQGNFGNYPSGHSYKPVVRKDLFKYTVIETADFAFYKWNRANLEPDVFGHIKNTLVSVEGVFSGWNNAGNTTSYGAVRAGTTQDLADVFPDSVYPLLTNLIGAFSPEGDGSASFNSDLRFAGIDPWERLDLLAFVGKFPNCTAGSAFGDRDGRRGAFKNLQVNCDHWDDVAAIDDGIWTD